MLETRSTTGGWLILSLGITVLVLALSPDTYGRSPNSKKDKQSSWQETRAGDIPDEFGDLVSSSSLGSSKNLLVFRDTGGDLRFVEIAKEVKKVCTVVRRCETKLKKGSQIPNGYGWTEIFAGSVPKTFGELVDVATNGHKKLLTFRNDEAQIRIIEYTTVLPTSCLRIDRQYHKSSD